LANYYILKILFGLYVDDYQNIQFHRTKKLQSYLLHGESAFLGIEMLIRSVEDNCSLLQVPIRFIPRKKGIAKGIRVKSVINSVFDILRNWIVWGWKFRFSSRRNHQIIWKSTNLKTLPTEVCRLLELVLHKNN
tara:strand:- start:251 stop:652 length:402 start_codon:yes stop_codon:yes gene_type:complete